MESRGAVLSAAGWGQEPRGLPRVRFGRFCGNGGSPGGATLAGTHRGWCRARGYGEGASIAGNVPAVALVLGLPFWGGGYRKQPPPPWQRTELPFTSSHGSGNGLAGNTARLVLPQPAPCSSPGAATSLPRAGAGGCGSWGTVRGPSCFGSLSPCGPSVFPGGKEWPYPVSLLLSRQRKAGGVATAAEIREIIVGVGKIGPGEAGAGRKSALSRVKMLLSL